MINYKLSLNDLKLSIDEIHLNMGYKGNKPDDEISEKVAKIIDIAHFKCSPEAIVHVYDAKCIDISNLLIGNKNFRVGTIINAYLSNVSHVAVFICTAGKEYDVYLKQLRNDGEIVDEFIADAIGSEIVEATLRHMLKDIENEYEKNGFTITNPYSPGYCGWSLKEQSKLFSLFPEQNCGVSLNESSLMTPIKSISGIVGMGKNLIHQPYTCDTCKMQNCYKRKIEN